MCGVGRETVDNYTYNAVISACEKGGQREWAFRVLAAMKELIAGTSGTSTHGICNPHGT